MNLVAKLRNLYLQKFDAQGVRIGLYSKVPQFNMSKFIFWYSIWLILATGSSSLVAFVALADKGVVPAIVDHTEEAIFTLRGIRMLTYFVCIYGTIHRQDRFLYACAWLICLTVTINAILYIKSLISIAGLSDVDAKLKIQERSEKNNVSPEKVRARFNSFTSVFLICMVCCNLPLVYACYHVSWYIRLHPVPNDNLIR